MTFAEMKIACDLTDPTELLMLADVAEEEGNGLAGYYRHEAELIIDRKARDDKDIVWALQWCAEAPWTRERASREKGYDARLAMKIFANPKIRVVVITRDAPTSLGFRLLRGAETSPILFYRKSSGGRWRRSVQQRYVRPR